VSETHRGIVGSGSTLEGEIEMELIQVGQVLLVVVTFFGAPITVGLVMIIYVLQTGDATDPKRPQKNPLIDHAYMPENRKLRHCILKCLVEKPRWSVTDV